MDDWEDEDEDFDLVVDDPLMDNDDDDDDWEPDGEWYEDNYDAEDPWENEKRNRE